MQVLLRCSFFLGVFVEQCPVITLCNFRCLCRGSFFSCSGDGTIRLWSLPAVPSDTDLPTLGQTPSPAPRELRALLRVGEDAGGTCMKEATGGGVRCLRVSPDGNKIACGDRAGNLRVYDVKEGAFELECMLEVSAIWLERRVSCLLLPSGRKDMCRVCQAAIQHTELSYVFPS